jgi:hypothetical protein
MEILLVLFVVLPLAAWFIAAPLWRGRVDAATSAEDSERAELEAARDAKYAEIRDAELDYRTGKLSEADWRALDRRLRGEAVEVLHRLDELQDPAAAVVP